MATGKPTKKATKRCAKRMGRALEKLRDERVTSVAFGAVGTPACIAAAEAVLSNICKNCGWCERLDIS